MTGRYRLTHATIALVDEGDSLRPIHLESLTVIEIIGLFPPNDHLLRVRWDEREGLMYAADLDRFGEPLQAA